MTELSLSTRNLATINLATVSKLVGENVSLSDNQQNQVMLKVTSVKPAPLHGDEWEAFSIEFEGDESFQIAQGTYVVSHEAMGEQELFITAHGPTEYGTVISQKRQ